MQVNNPNAVIWFDGEFVAWEDAKVHVLTHSLHYGMGIFEGVRAYNTARGPAIFRLQEHTDRLFRSAKILDMKLPFDKETFLQAQKDVVMRNGHNAAYIRPICYYGDERLRVSTEGVSVHAAVATWEWNTYLGAENMETGIKVCTASYAKPHINTMMSKAKATGNYMNSTLALHEAITNGCEEALLLDTNGYVAEGTGENIFLVKDGALHTPELNACLDGITRRSIIEIAKEKGLQTIVRNITRDELYTADELFFTGTAAEVMPIRELDNREIGSGKRGDVTHCLQSQYMDIVQGKDSRYHHWLTFLE